MRPTSVKVLSHKVSVRFFAHVESAEEGDKLLGSCEMDDLRIVISEAQAEGKQRETLLHEVLHAIMSTAGLHRDILTEDEEEGVVKRMSPILLDVLNDNPKLIEYLTDRRVLGARSAR